MNKLFKIGLLALTTVSLFSCGNGGKDNTWTVQFMLNNGTTDVYKTVEVNDGEKVTAPSDPSRNGYTFGGWYTDANCTDYFDEGSEVITADTKLYASWASSGLSGNDTKPEDSSTGNENTSDNVSSEDPVLSDLPGSAEAPTTGFALLFNDTNYVSLQSLGDEKDFQGRDQFVAYAVTIGEGHVFKCYNADAEGAVWVEKVLEPYGAADPAGEVCFEVTDEGIKCLISGTYDIYVKMKWEDNTVYIGKAA